MLIDNYIIFVFFLFPFKILLNKNVFLQFLVCRIIIIKLTTQRLVLLAGL